MENEIKNLRNKKLLNVFNSSYKFKFSELYSDIDNLLKKQIKINTIFQKKVYQFFYKIKIPEYLKNQQNSLNNFKNQLTKIINQTDYEMERIDNRRDHLSELVEKNLDFVLNQKKEICGYAERYSELNKKFSEDTKKYRLIPKIENLEKQIESLIHKHQVANDNLISSKNELDIIKSYDHILRISNLTSERIYNLADKAEGQLRQVSMIYCSLGKYSIDQTLIKFLSSLEKNLQEIKKNYNESLEKIKEIIADSENVSMLNNNESCVDDLFNDMKEKTLRKSTEIETVLDFMWKDYSKV